MEIIGTLVQKLEPQTGTSQRGEWKKQGFVIETQDQFPKKVCIMNWNDKVPMDNITEGTVVTASINIESREFKGNWYTDVTMWRVVTGDASSNNGNFANEMPPPNPPMPEESAEDDLPF